MVSSTIQMVRIQRIEYTINAHPLKGDIITIYPPKGGYHYFPYYLILSNASPLNHSISEVFKYLAFSTFILF